ncbi:hypothetical protein [Ramlibacter sp.]|uniref:hypothetical protein n=1 Tax=Ramlibacter sp. TaxID=1917967 RepID=UPI003D0CCBEC
MASEVTSALGRVPPLSPPHREVSMREVSELSAASGERSNHDALPGEPEEEEKEYLKPETLYAATRRPAHLASESSSDLSAEVQAPPQLSAKVPPPLRIVESVLEVEQPPQSKQPEERKHAPVDSRVIDVGDVPDLTSSVDHNGDPGGITRAEVEQFLESARHVFAGDMTYFGGDPQSMDTFVKKLQATMVVSLNSGVLQGGSQLAAGSASAVVLSAWRGALAAASRSSHGAGNFAAVVSSIGALGVLQASTGTPVKRALETYLDNPRALRAATWAITFATLTAIATPILVKGVDDEHGWAVLNIMMRAATFVLTAFGRDLQQGAVADGVLPSLKFAEKATAALPVREDGAVERRSRCCNAMKMFEVVVNVAMWVALSFASEALRAQMGATQSIDLSSLTDGNSNFEEAFSESLGAEITVFTNGAILSLLGAIITQLARFVTAVAFLEPLELKPGGGVAKMEQNVEGLRTDFWKQWNNNAGPHFDWRVLVMAKAGTVGYGLVDGVPPDMISGAITARALLRGFLGPRGIFVDDLKAKRKEQAAAAETAKAQADQRNAAEKFIAVVQKMEIDLKAKAMRPSDRDVAGVALKMATSAFARGDRDACADALAEYANAVDEPRTSDHYLVAKKERTERAIAELEKASSPAAAESDELHGLRQRLARVETQLYERGLFGSASAEL